MPALRNHRQERFCQLIKQGIPPYRAYPQAGYKFHNGEPYRLRDNPRVKARIIEITKGLAMKTRVTVESVTEDLDRIMRGAEAAAQYGPAASAAVSKAKLHGHMIERKETGQPGDFQGLTTPEAVIAAIRAELGDKAAEALQAALAPLADEPAPEAAPALPLATMATPSGKLN